MAVFAALAVEQRRSYAALVETLEAERRDQQAVVDLLAIVSRLSYQFEDLSQKMLKAITAMKALQELFSNQAMNYELIITDLAGVTGGISAKALKWRKTWIESRIDAAVVHLHQVCFSLVYPDIYGLILSWCRSRAMRSNFSEPRV